MTPSESHGDARPPWIRRVLGWLWLALWSLGRVVLLAWATLAVFYSSAPWAPLRLVLAAALLAFGVWALWFGRRPRSLAIFAAAYACVLVWWSTIRPSNDRVWRPEVAVMPRATIDGDELHITGFRHFDYRTADDFTEHFEDRDYRLSHLTSVDFFVSFWRIGPVGHTFVSFVFDDAPPLCISIETRPEVGEGFAPVASLFKQFELIYVIGDERDLVGVRTNHRHEDVFLYHVRMSPESARRLLLVYLERVNRLADHPEFYNLLSNSCTVNIVRYANRSGRTGGFDARHLLNGWFDGYLFDAGLLDTSMTFEELRRRSRINDAAASGSGERSPDFSERIRAGLPHPSPPLAL